MLQVWKIVINDGTGLPIKTGWALARTARGAINLSGYEKATIKQMPEHLWIACENLVWDS